MVTGGKSPFWPFAGRRSEMEFLHAAAKDPEITAVVVSGSPGVGKSRLLREAMDDFEMSGWVVRHALVTEGTSNVPFGALASVLPAELFTGTSGAILWNAMEALTASSRPLVVGADDVQLLDPMSVALLYQLAREGKAFTLLSVGAGEQPPAVLGKLRNEGLARRLELEPFSRAQVGQVLGALLDGHVEGASVHRLWKLTLGNAELLREVVDAGLADGRLDRSDDVWRWRGPWAVSDGLREVVLDRLGRPDDEDLAMLETLAFGEPLRVEHLTAMFPETIVQAAEARGLISVGHHENVLQARIAVPLYGIVLREVCQPLRARELRRRLVHVVESHGDPSREDRLRVADWSLTIDRPIQRQALVTAMREACAVIDFELAARLAAAAIAATKDFEASCILWRVLLVSCHRDGVTRALDAFEDLDAADRTAVDVALGRAYFAFFWSERPEDAIDLLRALSVTDDEETRQALVAAEAYLRAHAAQFTKALTLADDCLDSPSDDVGVEAQALFARGTALTWLGERDEALRTLTRAQGLVPAQRHRAPWLDVAVVNSLFHTYMLVGDFEEAARLADTSYVEALEHEWEYSLFASCLRLAQLARLHGRLTVARRWLKDALALHRDSNATRSLTSYFYEEMAGLEAVLGNGDAAAAALANAERAAGTAQQLYQPWLELTRTWVVMAQGDQAGAVALALRTAGSARDELAPDYEAFALHDVVRLGASEQAVNRLQELSRATDNPLTHVFAEHATASADQDGTSLEAVAQSFGERTMPIHAAEACMEASRVYRENGSTSRARKLRATAALLMQRAGEVRTVTLRDVEPLSLTPREYAIANLAATGLPSREIADRLTISVRTVDNHLHRVYDKLGLTGRSELTSLLNGTSPPHRGSSGC